MTPHLNMKIKNRFSSGIKMKQSSLVVHLVMYLIWSINLELETDDQNLRLG